MISLIVVASLFISLSTYAVQSCRLYLLVFVRARTAVATPLNLLNARDDFNHIVLTHGPGFSLVNGLAFLHEGVVDPGCPNVSAQEVAVGPLGQRAAHGVARHVVLVNLGTDFRSGDFGGHVPEGRIFVSD